MNQSEAKWAIKNRVGKWMLAHRTRVSNKLSMLGNDLAIRGRRHDNSYTDDTEAALFVRWMDSCSAHDTSADRDKELLKALHSKNNDYLPGYHENGFFDMNLIQVIELICDRMAAFEETLASANDDGNSIVHLTSSEYYGYVLDGFPDAPEMLQSLIRHTVEYIVDKNAVIKKMIEKREKMYGEAKKE